MMRLLEGKKDSSEESMEQVRPGTSTLATLVEPAKTGPIHFSGWLTMIEPAMQDLLEIGQLPRLVLVEPHPPAEPAVVPRVHEVEAAAAHFVRGYADGGASEDQVGPCGKKGSLYDDAGCTTDDPRRTCGYSVVDAITGGMQVDDSLPARRCSGEDGDLEAVQGKQELPPLE